MNKLPIVVKYQAEYGSMKQSGVGQYVKLYDYRTLEGECAELSRKLEVAKAALEEVRQIEMDEDCSFVETALKEIE